jgi:hypothetical protein
MGGVEVRIDEFLTSALDGGEWSASRPDRLAPDELQHPLDTRLCEYPGHGAEGKNLASVVNRISAVQSATDRSLGKLRDEWVVI